MYRDAKGPDTPMPFPELPTGGQPHHRASKHAVRDPSTPACTSYFMTLIGQRLSAELPVLGRGLLLNHPGPAQGTTEPVHGSTTPEATRVVGAVCTGGSARGKATPPGYFHASAMAVEPRERRRIEA